VKVRIFDLDQADEPRVEQTAALLVAAFAGLTDTWSTIEHAREEVHESFEDDRISRIALDDDGQVIGWIGGISEYGGNAWELHPLAVRPDWQGRGVGRALVTDFEAQVRQRGGTTIYLMSDDEAGLTSIANIDLYPDPWQHLATITNHGGHPFEFYQRCGFVITGVIPDASGRGRPDILMAKRVR
jgi:aminoglycoside 6'-N-acetyltransferase I